MKITNKCGLGDKLDCQPTTKSVTLTIGLKGANVQRGFVIWLVSKGGQSARRLDDLSITLPKRFEPILGGYQLLNKTFGQFDANYIIFRNVEIFKKKFFQIKKYCEGK
jgi:hypothetical protein